MMGIFSDRSVLSVRAKKHKMKKYTILILVAVIFGLVGYIIGGVTIGLRAAKNSNLASLVWINGIHEMLEEQKYEKAKKISINAEQAHFDVLKTLKDKPYLIMMMVLPWMPDSPPFEETLNKIKEQYHKSSNESESLQKP